MVSTMCGLGVVTSCATHIDARDGRLLHGRGLKGSRASIVREGLAIQCRFYEGSGIRLTRTGPCGERQRAAPALWGLRVNSGEYHPSVTEAALYHGRRSVRVPRNGLPPARELRAVFPVDLEGCAGCSGHGDGRFAYAAILERVERKHHAVREIEPVVWGRTRDERARANAQVAQAASNGTSKLR